jgi:maleamate amidohydrolase
VTTWLDHLNDEEREVIRLGGYGRRRGYGDRPALVLIDCQYNHIGGHAPILDQIEEWPSGAGNRAWDAVARAQPVLQACRSAGAPVIYTRYCHDAQGQQFDSFHRKRGSDLSRFLETAGGTQIVDELRPLPSEMVIKKVHASAFFGTALINHLIGLSVDTLLIGGVSTSGCVRATAVEAASLNFNVAVLADCVADRIPSSHQSSLLDLWMKYTDVVLAANAIEYLSATSQGGRVTGNVDRAVSQQD